MIDDKWEWRGRKKEREREREREREKERENRRGEVENRKIEWEGMLKDDGVESRERKIKQLRMMDMSKRKVMTESHVASPFKERRTEVSVESILT